jgi:hypothetical protein
LGGGRQRGERERRRARQCHVPVADGSCSHGLTLIGAIRAPHGSARRQIPPLHSLRAG